MENQTNELANKDLEESMLKHDHLISELNELISILEKRINFVLKPVLPSEEKAVTHIQTSPEESSILSMLFVQNNNKLSDQLAFLNSIINRIDL